MGSCISKCKPSRKKISNQKPQEDDQCNGGMVKVPVEDKLVITTSQDSSLASSHPTTQSPFFLSPCSPSRLSLATSCATVGNNCSSSSSSSHSSSMSSCTSSILNSKDKSYSPDKFLRPSLPQQHRNRRPAQLGIEPSKPKSQAAGSTQKRQRASSPNLTRQKSFRRDSVGPTSISASKASSLRSSSPSRRFNSAQYERNVKKMVYKPKSNGGYGSNNSTVVNKENLKGLGDPNNRPRRPNRCPSMRKRTDTCSLNKVVSRVNGISIGEEDKGVIRQDVEMLPAEDLENPLIALDCFIFL